MANPRDAIKLVSDLKVEEIRSALLDRTSKLITTPEDQLTDEQKARLNALEMVSFANLITLS